ncbi:hypothetical protein HMPREF1405_00636, partial [Helicobacter pylori GAM231Ai]
YHELVAFIPNTKDIWDFCLGGFKNIIVVFKPIKKGVKHENF